MFSSPSALLRRQLDHAFAAARWQVDGLTDEEYLWEPGPNCWSVRRDGDAMTPSACGQGGWVIDEHWPSTEPPGVPTVAWRLVHLAAWTDIYRDYTFGAARLRYPDTIIPGTAADAVAFLGRAQDGFASEVARLGDDDLDVLRPVHYSRDRLPVGLLVWQIAVEHIHHSAEIGVLRDLRRGEGRTDWWPEPTPYGRD